LDVGHQTADVLAALFAPNHRLAGVDMMRAIDVGRTGVDVLACMPTPLYVCASDLTPLPHARIARLEWIVAHDSFPGFPAMPMLTTLTVNFGHKREADQVTWIRDLSVHMGHVRHLSVIHACGVDKLDFVRNLTHLETLTFVFCASLIPLSEIEHLAALPPSVKLHIRGLCTFADDAYARRRLPYARFV
jgi:hypothetical protein